jgi:hypothetical protein
MIIPCSSPLSDHCLSQASCIRSWLLALLLCRPPHAGLTRPPSRKLHAHTFGDNEANGTNDVNWLKVVVDPKSREVFAYQAQIVPSNRVAAPAPEDQVHHRGEH